MTSPSHISLNRTDNESLLASQRGAPPVSSPVSSDTMKRLSYGSFPTDNRGFSTFDPENDFDVNLFLDGGNDPSGPPAIPSVLPPGDNQSTPLPLLPMIVLSIVMLGEFVSANASTPFLLFMVRDFHNLPSSGDAAFWTGVLVATFFLTQFLTSLLWATVAEKYGRRFVLVVSLLGGAITCTAFGATHTLETAMAIRLLQGVFAGSVGVAKSSVSFITDATNEGRAYAILGFCWGFGGVAGSIIGGAFERPCVKWPSVFGQSSVFCDAPYLLPCLVAGLILFTGAVLACFLGPDGGPRVNDFHEKSASPFDPIIIPDETTALLERFSSQNFPLPTSITVEQSPPPSTGVNLGRTITMSSTGTNYRGVYLGRTITMSSTRTSLRAGGSSTFRRPRLARNANTAALRRRASVASELVRSVGGGGFGEDNRDNRHSVLDDSSSMNIAERFVTANENAVTNIADLWVAAAMHADPGDSSDEEEGNADDDEFEEEDVVNNGVSEAYIGVPIHRGRQDSVSMSASLPNYPSIRSSSLLPHRRRFDSPHPGAVRPNDIYGPTVALEGIPNSSRLSSTIFANPGVDIIAQATDSVQPSTEASGYAEREPLNLAPIFESTAASNTSNESLVKIKPPSMVSKLPFLIIIQYGFLALHTTTHDQVFMSYLVTPYDAGGLNLNAGHFAQLIAVMSLAQIFYQFYLYPHLGPPRGPFSHLTMLRVGSCLFVPSYLVVIFFREPLAHPGNDAHLSLMSGLTASMALRFCGATFGFTSISILLNYMTPPEAVGYANGIAQSVVSLSRGVGPVLGGWLWSICVENNPSGYPYAFIACACFTIIAILHSFTIR